MINARMTMDNKFIKKRWFFSFECLRSSQSRDEWRTLWSEISR